MKIRTVMLLCLLSSTCLLGQAKTAAPGAEKEETVEEEIVTPIEILIVNEEEVDSSSSRIYETVEEPGEFPGGQAALNKWLSYNIRYPEIAQQNGIQGRVVIRFVVEKDGTISNVECLKGVDPSLDGEAMRIVKIMPKWIPGKINGMPVRSNFTLPVTFRLQDDNKKTPGFNDLYNIEEAKQFEKYGDEEAAKGNIRNAVAYYKEAFDINPIDFKPIEKSEELLKGNPEELMALYKNVCEKLQWENTKHPDWEDIVRLNRFLFPATRYNEKLVALDPTNFNLNTSLMYSYLYVFEYTKAIDVAQKLYPELKKNKELTENDKAMFLGMYSIALMSKNEWKTIIKQISPYTKLLTDSGIPLGALGICALAKAYEAEGKQKEADPLIRWVEENNPELYEYYLVKHMMEVKER